MASPGRIFEEKSVRGRLARLVRGILVAVLSAWLLYLIGINVFLSTSLFETAFAGAREDIVIEYGRGWSVWPGTIHARNLNIRGQDSNVEWRLHLDRISFDVDLLSLPRKRFVVPRAEGAGVTFRARRTLEAWPETADEVADLPPIPGRGQYKVAPAGPPSLDRWFEEHYHLWTVSLGDVRAESVREIWIDQGHFVGNALLTGSFYLKPIRAFAVGPAEVRIDEGQLLLGPRTPVLESLQGTAAITIDRNDPRALRGSDIFRFLSVKTDLHARSADLAGMPMFNEHGLASSGKLDFAALRLDLDHGRLRGARVEALSPYLSTVREGLRVTGGMHLEGNVAAERLDASVQLRDAVLARSDGERVLAIPALDVTTESRALDLADAPLRDLHTVLDLPALDVADTRRLDSVLPGTIVPGAGALHAAFHAESWRAEDRIAARAGVRGAAKVRLGDRGVDVEGLSLDVESNHLDLEDPFAALTVHATTTRLGLATRDVAVRGTGDLDAKIAGKLLESARFDVRDVVLARGGKNALSARRVHGKAEHVSLADPLAQATVAVHVDEARVHDAGALAPAGSSWGLAPSDGQLTGDLRLSLARHVARGSVEAKADRIGITTARGSLLGNADVSLAVEAWDIDAGKLTLAPSSIALTDLHGRLPGSSRDDLTASRLLVTGAAKELLVDDPAVHGIDAHLIVDDITLADARSLDRLLPSGSAVRVEGGSAKAHGAIALSSEGTGASGTIAIDVARGAVAVGKTHLTGDFALEAKLQGFDEARKSLGLAGSRLLLKNVAVVDSSTKQWDGVLVMKSADLRFVPGGPDLDALVWLEADDARPLLGVVLDSGLPKLLSGLVTMPHLRGRARLHFGPHVLHVADVVATGGDVALRGAYGIYDETRRGAFVVEKGAVSVGLRLDESGAHPKLFGLDGWLTNQLDEDAQRAAKKGEARK